MRIEPSIQRIYTFEDGEILNESVELSDINTLSKDTQNSNETVYEILIETRTYGLVKWSYRDKYSRDLDFEKIENQWLKNLI